MISNATLQDVRKTFSTSLESSAFKSRINECFDIVEFSLISKSSGIKHSNLPLSTILVEALRQNITDSDMKVFLGDTLDWNEEMVEYFVRKYEGNREVFRSRIQYTLELFRTISQ